MPDLKFQVLMAEPEPYAAGPLLKFKLHVTQSAAAGAEIVPIHAVTLQCQIRIDPAQRRYATAEQEKLLDLFDKPSRWGQTLRPMLWTHASVAIGPFTDAIRGRLARAVHVRLQPGRDQVLLRPRGWRDSGHPPVQRHDVS